MFVLLLAFFFWVDKKKREAFPDEFSLTRIFKSNNKGPDPSLRQVRSSLSPRKSVSGKKTLGITPKSKRETQFIVKR